MALRDQLIPADGVERICRRIWTERDARAIADVALGVPTPEAAAFLLEAPEASPTSRASSSSAPSITSPATATPETSKSILPVRPR